MYAYLLKRSDRRTLSLEITPESEVLVRAPMRLPKSEIDRFVEGHRAWIQSRLELSRQRAEREAAAERDGEPEAVLREKLSKLLDQKIAHYGELMQLKPASVRITSARKRFGSCSAKNGLCFSYRLMLYPERAIDYVVVHELAHLRYRNHGREFYALIEKHLPDYKERRAMLRT